MKELYKTILIVCEGEGTEPIYFESINDILKNRDVNIKVTISPKPKQEEPQESELRRGGKKKQLIKLSEEEEHKLEEEELEEEYRAQPIRYVRLAQRGLEDNSFDEVWAVFDKDNHPKHKEAFELAEKEINHRKVNIAFSSIAFEEWRLLHYEQNKTGFAKVQCREKKTIFNCGTATHDKDCQGSLCICGYMINKGYITKVDKQKEVTFSELPDYKIAIANAYWLRKEYDKESQPIYDLNPYTDVDKLVFKLMQLPKEYIWFNKENPFRVNTVSLYFEVKDSLIKIRIENLQNPKAQFILNQNLFELMSASGEVYAFGDRKIIEKEHIIEFDFSEIGFTPIYISYKANENEYLISDL